MSSSQTDNSSSQPQEQLVAIDSTQTQEILDDISAATAAAASTVESSLLEGQSSPTASSMVTNVSITSSNDTTCNTTINSMEEEADGDVQDTSMVISEVVPTPTTNGSTSGLFEMAEESTTAAGASSSGSPNKRLREEEQDESATTDEQVEEDSVEDGHVVEQVETMSAIVEDEPQAKKVKPNDGGEVESSSVEAVAAADSEDDEVTLVYEDKERALSFYKTVFEVEVVEQPAATEEKVESCAESSAESGSDGQKNVDTDNSPACEPDDVKIKGFKLNAKLSPKKKVQSLPRNPRIFIPSEKLQTTLERIKGFEGACVEQSLDFTCITCPEGNKLTLVQIDV